MAFCLGLAVASFGFYAFYPVPEDAQRGSAVGKEYAWPQIIPSTPSDQLDVPEPTSNPLESGPAAPIEFSVQELDLGLRLINEAASGAITVANKGDVPVELLTVSPTCGCLSTNFPGRTSLAPGESLQVDVYHELRSMASSTSEGLRFVFLGRPRRDRSRSERSQRTRRWRSKAHQREGLQGRSRQARRRAQGSWRRGRGQVRPFLIQPPIPILELHQPASLTRVGLFWAMCRGQLQTARSATRSWKSTNPSPFTSDGPPTAP